MTRIEVAPAGDRATTAVLEEVGRALAAPTGADVRLLPTGAPEASAQEVLDALTAPGVLLAVVGAGATAWQVATRVDRPVVVVPRRARPARHRVLRVLLPLDGTPGAAAAADGAVALLGPDGVEPVVLHVFDGTTVPAFWDQPAHALASWGAEFLARWWGDGDARFEVRHGAPGDRVLEVAVSEDVDLVALGWSQCLDDGRARTVRRVATEGTVPVLLVPLGSGGVGPSALLRAHGAR